MNAKYFPLLLIGFMAGCLNEPSPQKKPVGYSSKSSKDALVEILIPPGDPLDRPEGSIFFTPMTVPDVISLPPITDSDFCPKK